MSSLHYDATLCDYVLHSLEDTVALLVAIVLRLKDNSYPRRVVVDMWGLKQ